MGVGGNLFSAVTGHVSKALIVVYISNRKVNLPSSAPPTPMQAAADKIASAKEMADLLIQTIASLGLNAPPVGTEAKFHYVQFNPSSIKVTGKRKLIERGAETNDNQEAVNKNMSVLGTTKCSFKLYYDEFTASTAFMGEGILSAAMSLNPVSIGKAIVGAFQGDPSVKPYVDALIGAITNRDVKQVSFVWDKFTFMGKIEKLDVTYTMFGTNGNPIRAEVDVTLVQGENLGKEWAPNVSDTFSKGTGLLSRLLNI